MFYYVLKYFSVFIVFSSAVDASYGAARDVPESSGILPRIRHAAMPSQPQLESKNESKTEMVGLLPHLSGSSSTASVGAPLRSTPTAKLISLGDCQDFHAIWRHSFKGYNFIIKNKGGPKEKDLKNPMLSFRAVLPCDVTAFSSIISSPANMRHYENGLPIYHREAQEQRFHSMLSSPFPAFYLFAVAGGQEVPVGFISFDLLTPFAYFPSFDVIRENEFRKRRVLGEPGVVVQPVFGARPYFVKSYDRLVLKDRSSIGVEKNGEVLVAEVRVDRKYEEMIFCKIIFQYTLQKVAQYINGIKEYLNCDFNLESVVFNPMVGHIPFIKVLAPLSKTDAEPSQRKLSFPIERLLYAVNLPKTKE